MGTGLSATVTPELWLGLALLGGTCSALFALYERKKHKIRYGAAGDIFLAFFLVSGVALYSCLRIEAQAGNCQVINEMIACLRGTVTGFSQPSEYGTDLMISTLRPDSVSASLPAKTKVLVKIRGRSLHVSPGDTVSLAGLLRSPFKERSPGGFSEAAYLFQTGARAVLTVPRFSQARCR